MLRTKGGCRIRRSSMSLPCRPAVIFLPLPRCILWNHRQAGDRRRSTCWTGYVLHGSDHGQEGCRLGRHGSVRHQRSFDRCGAVRCGAVGRALLSGWHHFETGASQAIASIGPAVRFASGSVSSMANGRSSMRMLLAGGEASSRTRRRAGVCWIENGSVSPACFT